MLLLHQRTRWRLLLATALALWLVPLEGAEDFGVDYLVHDPADLAAFPIVLEGPEENGQFREIRALRVSQVI